MEQDLFKLLPSEITFNILSRLPVRAIATSKCVCKPWLDLLETDDFVNSHLSKSVPALAVLMEGEERNSMWCKVFEFEDGEEADDVERRYNLLTEFDFPLADAIVGAIDGLLLLVNFQTLYICNPITREYVELCCGNKEEFTPRCLQPTFGFGVSKITGQHKFVHISRKPEPDCGVKCHVYTLETGLWRRSEANADFENFDMTCGAFVNGNLHWKGTDLIAGFDLETECLSMFSVPPLEKTECPYETSICALEGYLCVCAVMPLPSEEYDFDIDVWLMKEYGVEKSWTKEYVIKLQPNYDLPMGVYHRFYPMKVSKNGDILILWWGEFGVMGCVLFNYSNKTQTAHRIGMPHPRRGFLYSSLLTPTFLSLKRNLGMENVISF